MPLWLTSARVAKCLKMLLICMQCVVNAKHFLQIYLSEQEALTHKNSSLALIAISALQVALSCIFFILVLPLWAPSFALSSVLSSALTESLSGDSAQCWFQLSACSAKHSAQCSALSLFSSTFSSMFSSQPVQFNVDLPKKLLPATSSRNHYKNLDCSHWSS